ncbi:MAG: hypothetical protein HQL69_23450 [Magnetococcales bacterium]|nr:hypothetical protein [Magnetococcales bacterium]
MAARRVHVSEHGFILIFALNGGHALNKQAHPHKYVSILSWHHIPLNSPAIEKTSFGRKYSAVMKLMNTANASSHLKQVIREAFIQSIASSKLLYKRMAIIHFPLVDVWSSLNNFYINLCIIQATSRVAK